MKKILFVVNVDWFFVSHRLPIAVKAMNDGFDVTIACKFTGEESKLKKLGFNVIEIPFDRSGGSLFKEVRTILRLRALIRELRPSLIHAITIKPVIYSGLALRLLKRAIPLVVAISGMGYVFTASTLRASLTKFAVSFLYKIALRQKHKIVIFQNNLDDKTLSSIVDLKQNEKVLIKGSGADLSRYIRHEEPTDGNAVVMASRLLKEKGVYEYVESAKIIKEKRNDVIFYLVGSPDPENPNSIRQNEIDEWVRKGFIQYLGHRDDIPDIFSKSNIVCLPSFYGEGVPKVLIEAAACGRAIVTTSNAGCRDAVIENETGLLVSSKNVNELTLAIQYLLDNKQKRINMGICARRFAEDEFDVENVVKRHIDIYQKLLVESNL